MKDLKKQLMAAAKAKGMCDEGKRIIRKARSVEEMLQQYHDHIGWHMENDNPPEAVLKEHFAGFHNEWAAADVKGVEFTDQEKVLMVLGSEGETHYTTGKRGRVFVRHNSELTVYAQQKTFVVVSAYENARVRIRPEDTARVCVFLHGNSQLIDTPDMPKQITVKTR